MNAKQKPPPTITIPASAPSPSPVPSTSNDRSSLPTGFVKPNLKDYVALPGKKWEISRDAFRATAISHGFLSALEGLPPGTNHSEATLEHQRLACQFMFGALKVALSNSSESWIAMEYKDGESVELWERLRNWHEGAGNRNSRYEQALRVIQSSRLRTHSLVEFDSYCNKMMSAFHVMEELSLIHI